MRHDKLLEKRTTFQRQTLLDLQEAAMQAGRFAVMIHQHDKMALHTTGEWHTKPLPDKVDEDSRLAQLRIGMLGARVRDDSVRELVAKLQTQYQEIAFFSKSLADSERAMNGMLPIIDELNQRIGEILRTLDDAEQVQFP